MASDHYRGMWEHGDPLWPPAFFERTEIEAYRIFNTVAKALGRLHDPMVTQKQGCRTVIEEFRPIEGVATDPLGNPFPDGGTRTLKLQQTSWVSTTPPGQNKKVTPVIVEPVLIVVETAFGEDFEQIYTRPELSVMRCGDLAIRFAGNPLDYVEEDRDVALTEQAQYLGWLELVQARQRA